MTRNVLLEALASTILLIGSLILALIIITSDPEPPTVPVTLPVTGEAIRQPVDVYQLETGEFVHKWLDEPWGLACVAIRQTARGPLGGVSCIELPRTTYGLPALDAPAP